MKITISNFLTFSEPVSLDLKKINLFIGANNCGKSTFAKFITLFNSGKISEGLGDINFHDFEKKTYSKDKLTFSDFLNDKSKPIEVSFKFHINQDEFVYSLEIDKKNGFYIDNYQKRQAGNATLKYVGINNNTVFELGTWSKKNIKHILNQTLPFFLDCGITEFQISQIFLSNTFEQKVEKNPLFENSNLIMSSEIQNSDVNYFFESLKKILLEILKNQTQNFSLISDNTWYSEVYIDDMKSISEKIYEYCGIKIVYRDVHYVNASKNTIEEYNNSIQLCEENGNHIPLTSMGTGFQNFIKIFTTIYNEGFQHHIGNQTFLPIIQEPEIGLHPNWQVLIFKILAKHNAIIETHSLVILRALQLEVAEGNFDPEDVLIHNFYRDNNNVIRINPIRINKTGMLLGEFAKGFHEEISDIEMKLWQIQQKQINQN
jgi:predicted ATP-dependent endonuclease of OLD family